MGAGGWNKGVKGAPGGGFKGKKHTEKTLEKMRNKKHSDGAIQKLKNRPKECYKKPKADEIDTDAMCQYGCNTKAKYKFSNDKLCCSKHQNSCIGKRKQFSDRTDHKERATKSLATRTKLGITKTSRIKAQATMEANGTYQVLREKMQLHWAENPWQPNTQCPILPYKNTSITYQGTHEYAFLEKLEKSNGVEWLMNKVSRGPSVWYTDPFDNTKRLYISDFMIYNTIYEIKSSWTWNHKGTNLDLENKNKAKLNECVKQGYKVILVLNGEEIIYA
jgi:hypothetical protein